MAYLEFHDISKSFQGVHALTGVSFGVERGAVTGLIGENGAGKSTLMNVLGGVVEADGGRMTLRGSEYRPSNPSEAARAGVAFIHQELNLFGNLSIADNLFIDDFPKVGRLPWISRGRSRERARAALRLVDLDEPPDVPVERLAPGERQLVEIARALSADAQLIIFDEPTTSLTARETRRLFSLIERVREEGKTIIFISHELDDVLRLADTVVVLRDGEVVDRGPKDAFTKERMITSMVGRKLEQLFPERSSEPSDEALLDVRGVTQTGVVSDVSFTLHRGEVLGIFGLMGAGRTELARILFGLDPFENGEILLRGTSCGELTPRERIERGMAFVTEDRREEGLLMDAPVIDTVALSALHRYTSTPVRVVDRRRLKAAVDDVVHQLKLKTDNVERQPARHLSGGNQQKAVIGKWLMSRPSVFLMDEPTRGVDVGAKFEVYTIVDRLAADGAGVLCISSEVEELIGLCDRILVMSHGEIRGRFDPPFDREHILGAAFGETVEAP